MLSREVAAVPIPSDAQLLEWPAVRISDTYRRFYQWVRAQPMADQWRHGSTLKRLRAAYTVAAEYEALFKS